MNDISELFWQSTLEDIKKGYSFCKESDEFICLICGKKLTNGIIYCDDDQLYEAKKYIQVHIAKKHRSVFHVLINLDKKLTGLTDHQKTILELFYEGHSDNEIAKTLNVGSTSTIRNHRFSLREKQKQAKIFLAVMELFGEQVPKKDTFIEIPRNSKQVDDRFAITEQESENILAAYFTQGQNGPIHNYPLKEKKRVTILKHIIKSFDINKKYTEKETNDILKKFYNDYVILRRHLIEYGFMDRNPDGSAYWVKL
ncbi:DUF2087 domain-containing protein [Dendrosporobacter sp. 1207_IL3150]|uniref:DUF2087 domain-containing protein n=1 Tax=Dendrosporobacter sp. 1207_IL3150 TaxID=3084054 RepID=UPI002FDACCD0